MHIKKANRWILLLALTMLFTLLVGCGLLPKKGFYQITDVVHNGDGLESTVASIAIQSDQTEFFISEVMLTVYYGDINHRFEYPNLSGVDDNDIQNYYEEVGYVLYWGTSETWTGEQHTSFGVFYQDDYQYHQFDDYQQIPEYSYIKTIRVQEAHQDPKYRVDYKGCGRVKRTFHNNEVLTIPSDLLKKGLENSNKTSICFYIMQVLYSKQENLFVSYVRSGLKLNFESTDNGKKVKIS